MHKYKIAHTILKTNQPMEDRRSFLKKIALGASAIALPKAAFSISDAAKPKIYTGAEDFPTVTPRGLGLPITGTFLDEISHDLPHQNWGEAEWDADFAHMKALICGCSSVGRAAFRE